MNKGINFYSSEGCHLCEKAYALCLPIIPSKFLHIVDIVATDKLVALYGQHIPVLERSNDHQTLYWPFTKEQIIEFIKPFTKSIS